MERSRVLYIAKTKTAKVIKPSLTKHSFLSKSSLAAVTGSNHAPLASIEPDILVIPKGGDGANKTSVLREKVKKSATVVNICSDQALAADSSPVTDDKTCKELNGSMPPRTYIRQRSTTISDPLKENPNYRGRQRSALVQSRQRFSYGPATNEPKGHMDNRFSLGSDDYKLLAYTPKPQNVEKMDHYVSHNSYSKRRFDKTTDTTGHHETAAILQRHSYPYAEQTISVERSPPIAHKPRREYSKSTVSNLHKSDPALSDTFTFNSDAPDPLATVVRQESYVASKENHIDLSSNFCVNNVSNHSQTYCEHVLPVSMPRLGHSESPNETFAVFAQTQSSQESMTTENLTVKDNSLTLLPEMRSPVKFMTEDNVPLPEMYSTSESIPAKIQPRSARPSHMSHSNNTSRKPLTSVDICCNALVSDTRENRTLVPHNDKNVFFSPCTDQATSDIHMFTNNNCQYTPNRLQHTTHVIDNHCQYTPNMLQHTTHVIDKDSIPINHAENVSEENCDLSIIPEFKPRWKRNSMRLATQGYTSMSDLTKSVECVTGHTYDDITTESLSGSNNTLDTLNEAVIFPEHACSGEQKSEISESVSINKQHDSSCDVVFSNDEGAKEEKMDCDPLNFDDIREQSVTRLNRNGITRHSYRMATSGITDIWVLDDDMHGNVDSNYQISVTETKNETKVFETGDLQARKSSRNESTKSSEHLMPNSANQRCSHFERHDEDEQSTKIKRLSFLLATSSISDLTFLDTEFEIPKCSFGNEKSNASGDSANTTTESAYSSSYQTQESQQGQDEEGSSSSSGRRSSFGSVYSCRGFDAGRTKQSLEKLKSEAKHQSSFNKDFTGTMPTRKPNVASDSIDSDSLLGDTSFYCTASSDASFITTDGDLRNSLHLDDSTQRSPKLPSQNRWSQRRSSQDDRPRRLSSQDQRSRRLSSQNELPSILSLQDQRSPGLSSQDQRSPILASQDQTSHRLSSRDQLSPRLSSRHQRSPILSSRDQMSPSPPSQDQLSSRLSSQNRRSPRLSARENRASQISSQNRRSYGHLSHDQRSHGQLPQNQRSHGQLPQDQRSHGQLPQDQRSHGQLSQDQRSHGHLSQDQRSHGHLSQDQRSHGHLSQDQRSHGHLSQDQRSHGHLSQDQRSHGHLSQDQRSHGHLSQDQRSHGHLSQDQRYHGHLSQDQRSHGQLPQDQRSHGQLPQDQRSHGQLPQDQRSHGQLPQDQRSHGQLPQDQRSHGQLPQDQRSHGQLPQDQRSHGHLSQDQRSHGQLPQDQRSHGQLPQDQRSHGQLPQDQRSHGHLSKDQRSHGQLPQDQRSHGQLPQDQRSHGHLSQDQRSHGQLPQDQRFHGQLPQDHGHLPDDKRSHGHLSQDLRSLDLLSRDQTQWSPNNSRQTNTAHDSEPNNNKPLVNSTDTLKHSSPINNVLQCYGCGLNERYTSLSQNHWNRSSSRWTPNVSQRRKKKEWSLEDFKRYNSKHYSPARRSSRHPDWSPRYVQNPIRTFTKTDTPVTDQSSANGVPITESFISPSSSIDDFLWDVTPKFPPSLGRPRRKLYAGFDSQPLPMDSFLSDSSSVYSVQSYGSWGASRSAEVESVSKTPDTSPKVRAISSIASSTYSIVREKSHDEVFDFFSFTEKPFSAGENNQNLYLNRENSFEDDCVKKDNFYDLTFSKESLESHLSDSTTVGVEHQENADHNQDLEYTKSYLDVVPDSSDRYNNAVSVESKNRTNESRKHDSLNNSYDIDFRSSSDNRGECYSNNKLKLSMDTSSATTKPRCTPSEKYLSSKEIFDLIMTSDKNSHNGVRSLERQAHKMTKLFCVVTKCAMQQHKNTTC